MNSNCLGILIYDSEAGNIFHVYICTHTRILVSMSSARVLNKKVFRLKIPQMLIQQINGYSF